MFLNQLKKKRHTLSYRIIERDKVIGQGVLNAFRINNRIGYTYRGEVVAMAQGNFDKNEVQLYYPTELKIV